MNNEIWYIQAKKDARWVDAGHWFYDPVGDVQVAQAIPESDGRWTLCMDDSSVGCINQFNSIDDCKSYVADYYKCTVIDVRPSRLGPPSM